MAEKTLEQRIMAAAGDYGEFHRAQPFSEESRAMLSHLAALVAEACAPQPERVCRWRYREYDGGVLWSDCGESDGGVWWSDCGEGWCLEFGGLADNGVRFCQGCGGKVEEVEMFRSPSAMGRRDDARAALDALLSQGATDG